MWLSHLLGTSSQCTMQEKNSLTPDTACAPHPSLLWR